MSGHNKWSTIKNKKAKTDAAKGKIFTKIGREIVIAVKTGGSADPNLNSKLKELRQTDGFSRLPADYQNLMVQMNVADDYFKAKEKAAKLNQKLEEMEKELYQVKHDLITNQLKMESLQKGLMDADQYGEPELFVLNRRTDD